ncbi:MAG: nicotinate-nucleotide--dimethylbenzimidazole phosphoribosyltransferase [Hyphomicrobiaceae bacterium]|nr:nicotinate-nucleotide--dimethylbenzimidazole phosphoribosyltransferase [Hyphomicrobiaceae bacterium]
MMFKSLEDFSDILRNKLPQPDDVARENVLKHQLLLTKPKGSLGQLEELILWFSGWKRKSKSVIENAVTVIFVGNHGVTKQNISRYPSEVTGQMVANFEAGGAAINAISEVVGSELKIVPIKLEEPTCDITQEPAMSEGELLDSLNIGASTVSCKGDIFAFGEMGIGNTTVAATLSAISFGEKGKDWAGPGTGLDENGIKLKANVIDRALILHENAKTATDRLRCLGGRELAAIAGAIVAARCVSVPVILDGYSATAAIAPLFIENPEIITHCMAGHVSTEPGHGKLLKAMNLRPLLNLGMCLGEGTGATLAISILRAALVTHNNMATFDQAKISGAKA